MLKFFVCLVLAVCLAYGCSYAAEPGGGCAAYLGPLAKDGRPPKLTVRQRIPVEVDGYVQADQPTARIDLHWDAPGAYVKQDPLRPGRAFYYPGYRQGSYNLNLSATAPDSHISCATSMDIDVDVDYEQYVELRAGSRQSVRVMNEFTQFWMPLYVSVQGSRASDGSESDVESMIAVKLFDPRIYVGAGNRHYENTTGSISASGWGFGVERLPDVDRAFSVAWYLWRYPSMRIANSLNRLRITSYGVEFTQLLPRDRHFIAVGVNINDIGGFPQIKGSSVTPYFALGWRL